MTRLYIPGMPFMWFKAILFAVEAHLTIMYLS